MKRLTLFDMAELQVATWIAMEFGRKGWTPEAIDKLLKKWGYKYIRGLALEQAEDRLRQERESSEAQPPARRRRTRAKRADLDGALPAAGGEPGAAVATPIGGSGPGQAVSGA